MINIISSSRYKVNKPKLLAKVYSILKTTGVIETSVLNIVFVGKIKMKQVALSYKHEAVALPVLAFPYKEKGPVQDDVFGEIFICYPQAVLLAAERGKKVDDTIANLVEHGIQNILRN